MATSGIRQFDPRFAEIMAEAYSRIQIRGKQITQQHIDDAVRSANLLLIDFAAVGVNHFQLVEQEVTLASGTAEYNLIGGALDVWSAVYSKNGNDTPVFPIDRKAYHQLPSKTTSGQRPIVYFVDRGKTGNNTRTITLWPVPTSSDTLKLWVWCRAEDAVGIPENIGVAWEWFDAYAAGLCARVAEKYAPEQFTQKLQLADRALMQATNFGRSRADSRLRMRGYTR